MLVITQVTVQGGGQSLNLTVFLFFFVVTNLRFRSAPARDENFLFPCKSIHRQSLFLPHTSDYSPIQIVFHQFVAEWHQF